MPGDIRLALEEVEDVATLTQLTRAAARCDSLEAFRQALLDSQAEQ